AGLRAHDRHGAAGLPQPEDRIPQLQVLVELLGQDRHALALDAFHDELPSGMAEGGFQIPEARWPRIDRRSVLWNLESVLWNPGSVRGRRWARSEGRSGLGQGLTRQLGH